MDRNVYRLVLARALFELRRRARLKAEPLANQLGRMKEHSYRRIEAGRDPLHAKYAAGLARHLRETGLQPGALSYAIAVALDFDENGFSERHEPPYYDDDYARKLARELAVSDAGLSEAFIDLLSADSSTFNVRFGIVVDRMVDYLTSVRHRGAELPPGVDDAIRQISPVYLDMLINEMKRLAAFPPAASLPGIKQWESDNSRRFRRSYAITKVPELLESAAQSNSFDWSYLWREDFEGIFILSLANDRTTKAVEKALLESLAEPTKRRPARRRREARIGTLRSKLFVRSVSKVNRNTVTELLTWIDAAESSTNRAAETEPTNVWFYEMREPAYVLAHVNDATSNVDRKPRFEILPLARANAAAATLRRVWEPLLPLLAPPESM
jgi:hypothetical protein